MELLIGAGLWKQIPQLPNPFQRRLEQSGRKNELSFKATISSIMMRVSKSNWAEVKQERKEILAERYS